MRSACESSAISLRLLLHNLVFPYRLLLNKDYNRLRKEVNRVLKGKASINLTVDKSIASNSDRVTNVTMNIAATSSFHLYTKSL